MATVLSVIRLNSWQSQSDDASSYCRGGGGVGTCSIAFAQHSVVNRLKSKRPVVDRLLIVTRSGNPSAQWRRVLTNGMSSRGIVRGDTETRGM